MSSLNKILIGDYVWNDLNRNGVQDAGEGGLAGVVINLFSVEGTTLILEDTLVTDSNGNYNFSVLPGTYRLQFIPPTDYKITQTNGLLSSSSNSDVNPTTDETSNFTVDENGSNGGIVSQASAGKIIQYSFVDAGMYQTATLGGDVGSRVWNDINYNGIQDAGELGLSGITVKLFNSLGVLTASTTTDGNGLYQFLDLIPGNYKVQFIAPNGYGYSPKDATTDNLDSDAGLSGNTDTYTLNPGSNGNIAAGMYRLVNLGDKAWVDSNANGKQDAGDVGLSGVTVNLYNSAGTTLIASTTTDANGLYSFTNQQPGSYKVKFTTPTGYTLSSADQGTDDDIDSDVLASGFTNIYTLTPGATNNSIDAGFYQVASISNKVWSDANANGKQDTGETGLANVTVSLYDSTGTTLISTTTTDANGNYTLGNIKPGSYKVKFNTLASYLFSAQDVGTDDTIDSDAAPSTGFTGVITLNSGANNNTVSAGQYQPVTLGDKVWVDTNANGQQEAGEPGLAGVTVKLYDSTGATLIASTTTDANGNYSFAGYPPGSYKVQFTTPAGYVLDTVDVGTDDTIDSDVTGTGFTGVYTLAQGVSNSSIDAGFYKVASISSKVWSDANANGKQDAGEIGLAGVSVKLYDSTGTTLISSTTTDANGNYTLSNIKPGSYKVQFSTVAGYVFSAQDVGTDDSIDSDVVPGTGFTGVITLNSGAINSNISAGQYQPITVGNKVWKDSNANGKQDAGELGLPGVAVKLYDSTGTSVIASTTTDANGLYSFANQLPGNYKVQISTPVSYIRSAADQGSDDTIDSDILASGFSNTYSIAQGVNNSSIDAGFYRLASVGGSVWNDANFNGKQDAGEALLANASIRLYDATGVTVLATTTSDASGNYSFTNLTPNSYKVQFTTVPTYTFSNKNVGTDDLVDSDADTSTGFSDVVTIVSDQADTSVDVGMYKYVSIGDKVWNDVNANGFQEVGELGLSGITVQLRDVTGSTILATTTTNASGLYNFNYAPGSYTVKFILPTGFAFSPAKAGTNDAVDSDVNATTGLSNSVTLSTGGATTLLDAGMYQLVNLGDRAWLDLNANAVQDAGESGMANVPVSLMNSAGTVVLASTVTDANGMYSFLNQAPGTYKVKFTIPSGFAVSYGSDATGLSNAYNLTPGTTNNAIDTGYFKYASVGDTLWNDANGNGLQDSGEAGMAGQTVRLYDSTGTVLKATVITDANGKYNFANLLPGNYKVLFPAIASYVLTSPDTGTDDSKDSDANVTTRFAAVTLNSGDVNTSVDAGYYKPVSIGDKVWHDINGSGKFDAGDVAGAGLTVELYNNSNTLVATTITNASGIYGFSVAPGSYRVKVLLPSGYVFTTQDVPSDDTIDSDMDSAGFSPVLNMAQGTSIATVDAGYYKPTVMGDKVWLDNNVNGLQDAGEAGIANVTVKLLNGATVVKTTTTDANGVYSFTGNIPATYTVQFVAPTGYVFSTANVGADDNKDSDVTVAATGSTAAITQISGAIQSNVDAGMYQKVTISDRVWLDSDADGVQDAGESGLANITVKLYSGATLITSVLTDATGKYTFSNTNPGSYKLQFVAPATYLFSGKDVTTDTIDSDVDAAGNSNVFVANSGDSVANIAAGLYQNITIGNKVWVDTNANGIQDAVGETYLANVKVNLLDSSNAVIASDLTNASGVYALTAKPGNYRIQVDAPIGYEFSPSNVTTTTNLLDSDVDSAGNSPLVTYSSGMSTADLDAGMVKVTYLGDFVWTDSNANGKQDAGEPGLAGVTVNLYNGTTLYASTTTDSTGYYEFTKMPVGAAYKVQVVAPNSYLYVAANAAANTLDSDVDATGYSAAISVTASSTNTTVDAGLYQRGTIGNRVWKDLNANGIQDAGEPGMAGVVVNLYKANPNSTWNYTYATTTTDANGAYLFSNLDPALYGVKYNLPANYLYSPINQGTDDALDSDANVTTGVAYPTITSGDNLLNFDAGMYKKAVVGGTVWLDQNGNGLQDGGSEFGGTGIAVKLYNSANTLIASTNTDASGNYVFNNVMPGNYKVLVTALATTFFTGKDQGADALDSDVNSTGYTDVFTANSGDVLDFDAGYFQKSSINSQVWLDTNGNGIRDGAEGTGVAPAVVTNVTVQLYDSTKTNIVANTTTNASGLYSFSGVNPGVYYLRFIAPTGHVFSPKYAANSSVDSNANSDGFTDAFQLISNTNQTTIAAGIYKPIPLGDIVWLDANGNGKQDAGEAGAANVAVKLYKGAVEVASTTTDSAGKYGFTVAPGSYQVKFIAPAGYVFTNKNATTDNVDSDPDSNGNTLVQTYVSGDVNNTIDAGLYAIASTASLGNKVWKDADQDGIQDAGEVGIDGVTVSLYTSYGELIRSTVTAGGGLYQFTEVVPGNYRVHFSQPAGLAFTGKDKTADGSDSDVYGNGYTDFFTLAVGQVNNDVDAGLIDYSPATISDFVWHDLDADGVQDAGEAGISGITVELYNYGNKVATTTTNASGKYSFTGLTQLDYQVKVFKSSAYPVVYYSNANATTDDKDSDITDTTNGLTAVYSLTSGQVRTDVDAGMWAPITIGDSVTIDLNGSGQWDAGEPGAANVGVHLYNTANQLIASTSTNASGNYLFTNVTPGSYYVKFDLPSGYFFSDANVGTNEALDSDADVNTGKTQVYTFTSTQTNYNIDASIYKKADIVHTVWEDMDGDGLQDASEPKLSGVGVYLYTAAGALVASYPSDASGNVYFYNMKPGYYYTKFSGGITGYVFTPANQGSNDAIDSDANTSTGITSNFLLSSGTNQTTVDAGGYRPVSLGDKVWFDSNMNGVQNSGEGGVANAPVYLYRNGVHVATDTTDGNGNYSFTNQRPGDFQVHFGKPSNAYVYSPQNNAADGSDSDGNGSGLTGVYTLTSGMGTQNHIDQGMYAFGSISGMAFHDLEDAWGWENYYRDSWEGGVAGVHMQLYNSSYQLLANTWTDGNGNYSFNNLPAGTYRVFVPTNDYGQVDAGYWLDAKEDTGPSDAVDSDFIMDKANSNSYTDSWSALYSTNKSGNYGWQTSWDVLAAGQNIKHVDVGLTPLVLDLNGDGIHTLARNADSPSFDLLGNGTAIQSGWVSAEDGLLSIDSNHNGQIDNINELFGGTQQGDGFAKLASFDSNGDGLLDINDALFTQLMVWRDLNSNHMTDAGELSSLLDAGVHALTVAYNIQPELDAQGNVLLERSSATLADGSNIAMVDVYFNVAASDAQSAGVNLPTLQDLLEHNEVVENNFANTPSVTIATELPELGQLMKLYDDAATLV